MAQRAGGPCKGLGFVRAGLANRRQTSYSPFESRVQSAAVPGRHRSTKLNSVLSNAKLKMRYTRYMNKKLLSLPLLILMSCLLAPSLVTVARPGSGSSQSKTKAVGAPVLQEQSVSMVKAAGPDLWVAQNAVCQAEFTPQGFRYVPRKMDALQTEFSFSYRLKSIRSAEETFVAESDLGSTVPDVRLNEASYSRSLGITEVYQTLDSGVEQLFILNQNLNPAGEEVVITGEISTSLKAQAAQIRTPDGIVFYYGHIPIVRYGEAKAIDANGRELNAELALRGNQLSIVLSSAWLRDAAYPVTVDPFVGPILPIAAAGANRWNPAIATDTKNNRYLVVWEETRGTDSEIVGRLLDATGQPAQCHPAAFTISQNPSNNDVYPSVAYEPTSGHFLVVWEERTRTGDSFIRGRFVGEASDCAATSPPGQAIAITGSTVGLERGPSVAVGAPTGGSNRYMVAFLRRNTSVGAVSVLAQTLNLDGTRCGPATVVGTTSGLELRYQPAISYGEPALAEFFSIVYRASDNSMRMGRVAPTCGGTLQSELLLDRIVRDGPPGEDAAATNVRPSVIYTTIGHRWMANWIDFRGKLSAVLRWIELPPTIDQAQSNFATLLGANRYVRGISTASSSQSRDIVVGISTGTSAVGAGANLLVFHLHYDVEFFSTTIPRDTLTGGIMTNVTPVISPDAQANAYFVVWQRVLANGDTDIVGRSYVP